MKRFLYCIAIAIVFFVGMRFQSVMASTTLSIEDIRTQIDNCKVVELNERNGKIYFQFEQPADPEHPEVIPTQFEMVIENASATDVYFE